MCDCSNASPPAPEICNAQEQRQARRKNPRTYVVKGVKGQSKKTVQGGKHLSLSANYTPAFARAIFKIWVQSLEDL